MVPYRLAAHAGPGRLDCAHTPALRHHQCRAVGHSFRPRTLACPPTAGADPPGQCPVARGRRCTTTALRSGLIDAGLVPADVDTDLAPAVHCSPFYQVRDRTHELADLLSAAVAQHLSPRALQQQGMAALPSKFGLLVDDPAQSLRGISADLRLWVQPDQAGHGHAPLLGDSSKRYGYTSAAEAIDAALQVAIWFARQRMSAAGAAPTRLHQLLKTQQPELSVLKTAPQYAAAPAPKHSRAP